MKNRRRNSLYSLKKKGELDFPLLDDLQEDKYKPDSLWVKPFILVGLVILSACANFASFDQLFSSFLYDSVFLRSVAIFALLVGFDIAPVYLGYNLKKLRQGYNIDILLIIGCLGVIAVTIIATFGLRVVTANLAFADLSNNAASIYNAAAVAAPMTNNNALFYALGFSIFPLITSSVSFLAAYTMTDPLKEEVRILENAHLEIQNHIGQLQSVLEEYATNEDFHDRLLADDNKKYDAAFDMLQAQRNGYKHYIRERLVEYLGDPEATTYTRSKVEKVVRE